MYNGLGNVMCGLIINQINKKEIHNPQSLILNLKKIRLDKNDFRAPM